MKDISSAPYKGVLNRRVQLAPERDAIAWQATMINVYIFFLLVFSRFSMYAAFTGGIILLFYLSVTGFSRPGKVLFILFGTKLTYDALWDIKPVTFPWLGEVGMMELIFIPIIIIIFVGPRVLQRHSSYLIASGCYLVWVAVAMLLNGRDIDVVLMIRQAGMFLGLLLGLKYIRDEDRFNTLIYLIFLSTIIPVLSSLTQILAGQTDIPIFHYKFDTIRTYRYSGLYFDSATAGMVNVLSLLSNAYLIYSGLVKKRYQKVHMLFISLNILIIIFGGTRSIIIVASFVLIILLTRSMKTSLKLLPLLVAVIFIAKPYVDQMTLKTSKEVQVERIQITDMMKETEYRTMFTGRVSIWQDIWFKFKRGTFLQKLLGHGLSSNAHSSFFFLLLQIGWLGLLYYILFHLFLIKELLRRRAGTVQVAIALLALSSLLLIGASVTTVMYTSFQWITYLIVGSVLNLSPGPDVKGLRTEG